MRKKRGYMKRYIKYNLRKKGAALTLTALFLLGLFYGSRYDLALTDDSAVFLLRLCQPLGEADFLSLVKNSFASFTLFLLFWMLCGLSAVGTIFAAAAVAVRGIAFGIGAAAAFSTGGAWYYRIVSLPQMIIWLMIAIPAVERCCRLSLKLISVLVGGRCAENKGEIASYFAFFGVMWGCSAAGAVFCALAELIFNAAVG
ncbi:MAG: hypothetical protein IKV41_04870 [Oscillospiraceae bacterium]|nr:hypothetical protein [Oscillospiraceae bacterium]